MSSGALQRSARRQRGARTVTSWALTAALAAGLVGCIPEGPPTDRTSRRAPAKRPAAGRAKPPKVAPSPSAKASPARPDDPLLAEPFEDRFERKRIGDDWRALSPVWRIEQGELCARGARNRGIWLARVLPEQARIEFDARTESPDGDIKAEFWGDGRSGATAQSYTDATSYLTILGGWQNTLHVLARIDEHGDDRRALKIDPSSPDPRAQPVEPGQTYRFRVERSDDTTLSWWVDDRLYFELDDPEPLQGDGHDHFGFNDWMVPVCFDNLTITPL